MKDLNITDRFARGWDMFLTDDAPGGARAMIEDPKGDSHSLDMSPADIRAIRRWCADRLRELGEDVG
ncbi:MAG: hypothetical protein B7733_05835 [Myxococcales bacterium FL481]|nr:MAG: hypothetical protein B7733_05835 [Myxococcales bacterium FL481]